MMILALAHVLRGDRVGEYGPVAGIVAVVVVALWFYVLLGGPTGKGGPRK